MEDNAPKTLSGKVEEVFNGQLAKIIEVINSEEAIFALLPNGAVARYELQETEGLSRGDIVLLGDNSWRIAPQSTWHVISVVGVIRKRIENAYVVEFGGVLRVINGEPAVPVEIGNSVEFNEFEGIVRVISDTPLSSRDTGASDDLSEYRPEPTEAKYTFDSFGGYESVIARAKELIETQLDRREELNEIGAQPVKGVIFTGPPGTGKTHLARIIANVSNAEFFLVSGPSIVSKWVGDSEETLRRLFELAAKEDRAIIFFDEIDSIAARRSNDSHGESKRVVAQLLTLLDGFKSTSNIVVIAATNRVEDIDEALLRPGRFDWEVEFPLPSFDDRINILKVGASQLKTVGVLPLEEIAHLTAGWSGAKLTAIWTEAALIAAGDQRRAIADEDVVQAFERVNSRPSRARSEESHVA